MRCAFWNRLCIIEIEFKSISKILIYLGYIHFLLWITTKYNELLWIFANTIQLEQNNNRYIITIERRLWKSLIYGENNLNS